MSKEIYGLIGNPIKHSLSALMHNAAFSHLNIDAAYELFELKEEELEGFLKDLAKKNILGLNITFPYKEKAIPFLTKISPEAGLIGAVNTVKVNAGLLEGFNTDGEGYLRHLKEDLKFSPFGKNIALLGAGGAAKAIAVYLCKNNPGKLNIYDIDKDKATALSKHLRNNLDNPAVTAVSSIEALEIDKAHLLINATPIGMKETDPLLIEENILHNDLLVYDIIYHPQETKLLKTAKRKGCRVSNGLGMLLYQGVAGFEIWTGRIAPLEAMRQALEKGAQRL